MNELDALTLDGKEYIIIDEIKINNILYVHLANADNPRDFCVRKVDIIDNKEILIGLDNKEEFEVALKAFIEKNKSNRAI